MKNKFKFKPVILIVLIVFIITAFFATGAPYRAFAKLSVKDEYKDVYSEYENMSRILDMKDVYEDDKSCLFEKINELNIDAEILQDEIINELDRISSKNNIELSCVKFSEVMPVFAHNSTLSEESALLQNENTAVCMKVTVDFDSDFNDMLLFVDDIKNCETLISVTDIKVLTSEGKVHVSVNLMFYALPMNNKR